MPREATQSLIDEAKKQIVYWPVIFVEIALDTETIRVNSSHRPITWNGVTWDGVGDFGRISEIKESTELRATGISMELTGIKPDYIQDALAQEYQGRTVKVYFGLHDSNFQLVIDPALQFEGLIDQMNIKLGETATVELTAEDKLIRWETPNIRRYTNAEQQHRFPGDLGLEFLQEAVEKKIQWGPTTLR